MTSSRSINNNFKPIKSGKYKLLREIKRISNPKINKLRKKFKNLRALYYKELWEEAADNIGATASSFTGDSLIEIRRCESSTFVRNESVRANDSLIESFLLNKSRTQSFLSEHGFRVPKFIEASREQVSSVINFYEDLQKPVVLKPAANTAGGRGVTPNISDVAILEKEFRSASRLWPKLIIEEHVSGKNFRLAYLNGQLIDAIERSSPTIIGDGLQNIKNLIDAENNNRLNQSVPTSLLPLTIDTDCRNFLNQNNISLKYIPNDGELVTIKSSINENSSRDNRNVLSKVHPEIRIMGEEITEKLNIEWVGIDIITNDISLPFKQADCVVLELNIPPGIHYHYMIQDSSTIVPVAELLLNNALSKKY